MRTAGFRVASAAAIGLACGLVVALSAPWQVTVLAGWDTAAVVFLGWVWLAVAGMDSDATRAIAKREEPNALVADIILVGASVGCLIGAGYAIAKTHELTGDGKAWLVGLTILSVVVSWAVVHTVFALRYASTYYGDPEGGIDFSDEPPDYRDFAYLAFTVGMTYQVSDTALQTGAMRRIALGHALLSFLFGTFILAVTINIVAGLIGGS